MRMHEERSSVSENYRGRRTEPHASPKPDSCRRDYAKYYTLPTGLQAIRRRLARVRRAFDAPRQAGS
jgi:hypothetical protein